MRGAMQVATTIAFCAFSLAFAARGCEPAPATRVVVPNAQPGLSVAVPAGWEVNTYVHSQYAHLAMLPKREQSDSGPMYPELTVSGEDVIHGDGSLRSAIANVAGGRANGDAVVKYARVDGIEVAYWSDTSELVVDFIDGTGTKMPLKTRSAAVLVGGRLFVCSVQRPGDDPAPASDDQALVSGTCSGLRPTTTP